MLGLKMLIAAMTAAAAVTVANVPAAQANPTPPGQPYEEETPQLPQQATPAPPRGVLGCVRGACIPKQVPPRRP